jgi:hypothetical protein
MQRALKTLKQGRAASNMPYVREIFEDAEVISSVQFMNGDVLVLDTVGIFVSAYEAAQLKNEEVAGTRPDLWVKTAAVTRSGNDYATDYLIREGLSVIVDGRVYWCHTFKADGSGIVIVNLGVEPD